jgi:hypothetical protein
MTSTNGSQLLALAGLTVQFVRYCDGLRGAVLEEKSFSAEAKARSIALHLFARVPFWFAVNMIALLALLRIHFSTAVNGVNWWPDAFAVATNLLAGGIVSFLFFYLVVHYPEQRKKAIIKRNLLGMYHRIKRDMLWNVVFASLKGGVTAHPQRVLDNGRGLIDTGIPG